MTALATQRHDVFTSFEYVLIDIANHWGLDDLVFPKRIQWALENMEKFEELALNRGHWKEHPLFMKGVMALRRIQCGQATGHMIGFDAICSGMQVLSVLAGCLEGAKNTGMITPDERADAYTACTQAIQRRIISFPDSVREDIKQACMTALYGSVKIPESLFGEDTRELQAFYESLFEIAPGACKLIDVFKHSWQQYALNHTWVLPDNHHADIPVTEMVEARIEVDELDHTKFNYNYEVNAGSKTGISLIANVTHSVDAYILRSLIRRCSYDLKVAAHADDLISAELIHRNLGGEDLSTVYLNPQEQGLPALRYRYKQSQMVDISMIDHLTTDNVKYLETPHLQKLGWLLQEMATHNPFPIVCVHDEFKCSPADMNSLRMHYKNIMADLADSDLLNDIVGQINGGPSSIKKLCEGLGDKIRQSNYAIC